MNLLHQMLLKVNLLFILFLTNLTVPNKLFFRVKLLARTCCQVFNLQTTYKFKIKLLHNEETDFCTKTELSNFKFTLPLAKLDIANLRLASNGLVFEMIFQSITSQ